MPRVAGVNIPSNKRIVVALTYIYGIGANRAKKILKEIKLSEEIKVKDLSENQLLDIRKHLVNYKVEGELRREVAMNIKRLIEIKAYRGIRIVKNLPSRGQNTKCNAKTTRRLGSKIKLVTRKK